MSDCEGGSEIGVGEIVTLGLASGAWCWGTVGDVDDDTVTLAPVTVTTDLSTPPGRGGKVATGGKAVIERGAVVALVRGIFNEWE